MIDMDKRLAEEGSPLHPQEVADIACEVIMERAAQDRKWGEQHHDYIGGAGPEFETSEYDGLADYWKGENGRRYKAGTLGWDGILLEEVYEALAEEGYANQREELLQVAGVAMAMIEDLDRTKAKAPTQAECRIQDAINFAILRSEGVL